MPCITTVVLFAITMQLYALGLTLDPEHKPKNAPFLSASSVKVLWSSWCDAVIAHTDGVTSAVLYNGIGLTAGQRARLGDDAELKRAVDGEGRHAMFFGSSMHDGLRGYVLTDKSEEAMAQKDELSATQQKVVLFATDLEMTNGIPEVQVFSVGEESPIITKINFLSDESLMLVTRFRSTKLGLTTTMGDLSELRKQLSHPTSLLSEKFFLPQHRLQCVTNATTATILDNDRHVRTATNDPRYPKCLGRRYEENRDFAPVPYLSETSITKIVSGGYMSAALSSEGELFLWGQACPGSKGELSVLNENGAERDLPDGVSVEGEQDEFVKCLEVRIEGHEASVYDVAIGHGHILVAAELLGSGRKNKRVVYAAGDNSRNQLGLGAEKNFLDTFEEVVVLRGKQVAQLVAAGWSSFVVLLDK
ncbi:serine threonine- kinase nek9 [Pyrenophora seminiperda CCB06]|uniref:Serine threonine-kinase nek9 n=1 Tax=Pyrenophora seminiperda CCB06 TaxID=1302712 RepID=A0A3M7MA11_9PLEO|nr:serine threonine- kinase nek9 [Pyrenophora seminiperda CCB06]